MEIYSIDNLICRVIVGNKDYIRGIKKFENIGNNNFYNYIKVNRQKNIFTYEKIT